MDIKISDDNILSVKFKNSQGKVYNLYLNKGCVFDIIESVVQSNEGPFPIISYWDWGNAHHADNSSANTVSNDSSATTVTNDTSSEVDCNFGFSKSSIDALDDYQAKKLSYFKTTFNEASQKIKGEKGINIDDPSDSDRLALLISGTINEDDKRYGGKFRRMADKFYRECAKIMKDYQEKLSQLDADLRNKTEREWREKHPTIKEWPAPSTSKEYEWPVFEVDKDKLTTINEGNDITVDEQKN